MLSRVQCRLFHGSRLKQRPFAFMQGSWSKLGNETRYGNLSERSRDSRMYANRGSFVKLQV